MEIKNKISGWFRILGWLAKAGVIIASLAIAYYFVLALPAHDKAQLNFEKQKYLELKQSDCSKEYARLSTQFNNVSSTYFAEPSNTCMVKYFNAAKEIEETPTDNFHLVN